MLVKVKTPDLPLHLAGDTRRDDLTWNIVAAKEGWWRKAWMPKTSCGPLW